MKKSIISGAVYALKIKSSIFENYFAMQNRIFINMIPFNVKSESLFQLHQRKIENTYLSKKENQHGEQ